jgi:hypothetical protein
MHKTKHQVAAAYSPWINGLVENANGKLIGRLKRLCSPGLGEDEYENAKGEELTWRWPDYFDTAIQQLNERIIPAFQFSPKELLLGLVINTTPTPFADANTEPTLSEVSVQMAYVDQQRLDGANHAASHTTKRKATFDKKVLQSHAGEVIFESGQLVQVYANATEMTMASSKKLVPRWSAPRRVASRFGNSYTLTTLEGFPINGLFHARRLRRFIPRNGTALAALQEALQDKEVDEEEISQEMQPMEVTMEELESEEEIEDDEEAETHTRHV